VNFYGHDLIEGFLQILYPQNSEVKVGSIVFIGESAYSFYGLTLAHLTHIDFAQLVRVYLYMTLSSISTETFFFSIPLQGIRLVVFFLRYASHPMRS
jgi:hypothetical protein